MATSTLTLEGMEPLQAALRRAPELVKSLSADAIQRSSFAVASRAKALVPVQTGDLQRSIAPSRATRGGLNGGVGITDGSGSSGRSPAVYWRFVEFGTVRMPAQPFFRPAADEEAGPLVQRIRLIGQQLELDFSTGRFL